MSKNVLLVAEKPSVARSIQNIYNKMNFPDKITFKSLVGHVLSLKHPGEYNDDWNGSWDLKQLPMIPDNFSYKVIPNTKDVYSEVAKEMKSNKYDYIINACDNEREGQLIFHSVYEHTNCKLPVKRFWTADLSDKGIKDALNNLLDDSNDRFTALTNAAKLRSHFDWLLGMNLSRASTLKANATTPIGRVMTPTLAIVVNRENEIKSFVPQDFFELEADFGNYKGKWFDLKSNGGRFRQKSSADKLREQILKDKDGSIISVKKQKQTRNPFPLHSLAGLQKEANAVFGYSATETLEIAQTLYQDRKILTYPRTDSEHLPKNVASTIPSILKLLVDVPVYGDHIKEILKNDKNIKKTLKNKRYVDDSKVSDHYAIIPTEVKPNINNLTEKERNIYSLVVRKLTAIFLPPQITEKTRVVTKVGDNHFNTNGSVLIQDGFMKLFNQKKNDNQLPSLKENQKVSVKDVEVLQGQTTPPKRYTEGRLVELMENVGRIVEDEDLKLKGLRIGTAATTGNIIDKLVERKFMERKGGGKTKTFHALPFGIDLIKMLEGQDITSPELTAVWEKKLTDIEQLRLDSKVFEKEMLDYTKEVTDKFIKEVGSDLSKYNTNKGKGKSKNSSMEKLGHCPKCGKDVMITDKFIFCEENRKTCEFMISRRLLKGFITKADAKALISKRQTSDIEFVFKNGKSKAKLELKQNGDLNFVFPPRK